MDASMNSLCVFCGSRLGSDPAYERAARDLGTLLARRRCRLIYGGGSVGLMGIVADAVLAGGGEVVGVIPDFLATRELLHTGLTELKVVQTMHQRKALMAELSEGFLALPGGYGTLEELFEVITWSQLGLHRKPIGLLNTAGFFTSLVEFLDRGIKDGFIREQERGHLIVEHDLERILFMMNEAVVSFDAGFSDQKI